MRAWYWALLCLSCSWVDSVDGYAGPPEQSADAGTVPDSGSGGQKTDAATGCKDATDCDDDSPCTIDSCFGNLCHHEADVAASCDDGNPCNGNEYCTTSGACNQAAPPELDDGDDCTVDSCDPAKGVLHDDVPYPDIKVCGGGNCPSGYYRAEYLVCDTDCGGPNNCGFCINGSLCRKLCKKTHTVCCTSDCATSCPAGYSAGASSCSNQCGCNSCGANVTCTRN